MSPADNVDAYLAALPEDQRAALQQLRNKLRSLLPESEEQISYGVPSFKYRGRPLVSFGAGKGHCSFYVQSPEVMDAHKDDVAGYSTAKGTVHFSPDKPLPDALVKKLVEARIAENDAQAAKRGAKRRQ